LAGFTAYHVGDNILLMFTTILISCATSRQSSGQPALFSRFLKVKWMSSGYIILRVIPWQRSIKICPTSESIFVPEFQVRRVNIASKQILPALVLLTLRF